MKEKTWDPVRYQGSDKGNGEGREFCVPKGIKKKNEKKRELNMGGNF